MKKQLRSPQMFRVWRAPARPGPPVAVAAVTFPIDRSIDESTDNRQRHNDNDNLIIHRRERRLHHSIVQPNSTAMSTFTELTGRTNSGSDVSFSRHANRVVLVVNVARL